MKSKMQIISGTHKGKNLLLPDNARPTQMIAKIAIFNMLDIFLNKDKNIIVWDAFAGSGALGIECLSRYSDVFVYFTDNNKSSIYTVQQNTKHILNTNFKIIQTDAFNMMNNIGILADLIFIDPPYINFVMGMSVVEKLAIVAKSGTIIVWECEKTQQISLQDLHDKLKILKDKIYGRARFIILQKL